MISNFPRRYKNSTRNFCIPSAQNIQILSLTHLLSLYFLLDNLRGNGRYIFIYIYVYIHIHVYTYICVYECLVLFFFLQVAQCWRLLQQLAVNSSCLVAKLCPTLF